MATLSEQVQARLNDLDSQIKGAQVQYETKVKALLGKKEALLTAAKAITPEIEEAVRNLRSLDLLDIE